MFRSMVVAVCLSWSTTAFGDNVSDKTALGRQIFFDAQLSEPAGQSCATCHRPDQAFADPGKVVSPGANPKLFGNRNAPSIAYIKFNPEPYWNKQEGSWGGGFFLDGRVRTLKEQSKGPLLNPLEMANKSSMALAAKLKERPYASELEDLYGDDLFEDPEKALDAAADALAHYEKGPDFAKFTSRYDAYLRGEAELTPQEKLGLELFENPKKGNCAACHVSRPTNGTPPLFTDFSYDNVGAPRNENLPFLRMSTEHNPDGNTYRDFGLANAAHANLGTDRGKFKVPTLRNIAKTAPYMHNGVFTDLRTVVDFYNRRNREPKWGVPEVWSNLNVREMGDLGLTGEEVDAITAFLEILNDR